MKRHFTWLCKVLLKLVVIVGVAWFLPAWLCGLAAEDLYEGDRGAHLELARSVARSVSSGVTTENFSTGSARFDGEWAVVTHQMAALGLGQVIIEHPETRDELLPAIDSAIKGLREPSARHFGTTAWREDGFKQLSSSKGHAYLGYINLALGMDRMLRPESPHAKLHDQLTDALARRLASSRSDLIETYPGETYPADVAAVAGSIGLHLRVTGHDPGGRRAKLLDRWSEAIREQYMDDDSGLLVQCVRQDGSGVDHPRASGTAIAAYFVSFADRELSRDLYRALQKNRSTFAGFGGIREYPRGTFGGLGDIDSGPVLFGVGISSTGFSLSSARIHRDRETYSRLYRTAHLFGVPVSRSDGRWFVTGGPLGNAILLAMLTAGPAVADPHESGGDQ